MKIIFYLIRYFYKTNTEFRQTVDFTFLDLNSEKRIAELQSGYKLGVRVYENAIQVPNEKN